MIEGLRKRSPFLWFFSHQWDSCNLCGLRGGGLLRARCAWLRMVLSAYGAGTALPGYDHHCRGGHFRFGRRLSALTARPPCAARRAHPARTVQGAFVFNLRSGRAGRGRGEKLGSQLLLRSLIAASSGCFL